MSRAPSPRATGPRWLRLEGGTAVGLGFVYLGIPLLAAVVHYAPQGSLLLTASLAVCLIGSLALGVGLCAHERWAWAAAVSLCVLAAGCSVAVAGAAIAALAAQSRALSWQPVFWGLPRASTQNLVCGAALTAGLAAAAVAVLWRGQADYDVPHRRAYTTLAREGALPAAVVLLAAALAGSLLWPQE
jgi:hypothetical protein